MSILLEERQSWREYYKNGGRPDCPYLNDYVKNRDSDLWRSTRALEKLCEYILYLEEKIMDFDDIISACESAWARHNNLENNVISFRDRTWCASPDCKGECGRKMTPEIRETASKQTLPIAWGNFCGGDDYPNHTDIQKAMSNDTDSSEVV